MKSSIAASVLLASLALAAPFDKLDKRAQEVHTDMVYETVVVYTTIYDGETPDTQTAQGKFYEVNNPPAAPTTTAPIDVPAETTPTPVAQPSVDVPKVQEVAQNTPSEVVKNTPTPTPSPSPVAEVKTKDQPASSGGSGEVYKGGSYTLNYYSGGTGACGEPIQDTDMAVALAQGMFGTTTFDYMTGKTTNSWCGKTIAITNNGVTVNAKIMDRCPGCTGAGLDATKALWDATTGSLGGSSGDRVYSMSWQVVN